MKYEVKWTSKFKKDYKRILKQNKDISELDNVIIKLANGEKLSKEYKDHALEGNHKGKRECHIDPDWLLMYEYDNSLLILYLVRTGSHNEILNI